MPVGINHIKGALPVPRPDAKSRARSRALCSRRWGRHPPTAPAPRQHTHPTVQPGLQGCSCAGVDRGKGTRVSGRVVCGVREPVCRRAVCHRGRVRVCGRVHVLQRARVGVRCVSVWPGRAPAGAGSSRPKQPTAPPYSPHPAGPQALSRRPPQPTGGSSTASCPRDGRRVCRPRRLPGGRAPRDTQTGADWPHTNGAGLGHCGQKPPKGAHPGSRSRRRQVGAAPQVQPRTRLPGPWRPRPPRQAPASVGGLRRPGLGPSSWPHASPLPPRQELPQQAPPPRPDPPPAGRCFPRRAGGREPASRPRRHRARAPEEPECRCTGVRGWAC